MKFGVREIVDVVFKATTSGQRIGDRTFAKYQPVFMIDTATTSSLEQATTTVYAQGGKGYARLIAWEGEKTMTFTVTDALMSPMGLAVLTGAGLIHPNKDKQAHVHTTVNVGVDSTGKATISVDDLNEEFGLDATDYAICKNIDMFATELDGSGAGIEWFTGVTVEGTEKDGYIHIDKSTGVVGADKATFTVPGAKDTTVQLDFYVVMNNSVTEVQIEPESFGGYFYVEAQTLFRREDTGKDMAAEIIIPKAKIQSAFTFTMAASGDPSTFDFVMDAMPGYTRFDATKKQMCVIQIVGDDKKATGEEGAHVDTTPFSGDSPSFSGDEPGPTPEPGFDTDVAAVPATAAALTADMKINQGKTSVTKTSADNKDTINVTISGGIDSLKDVEPKTGWGEAKWVALDYNTGEDTIEGISYTNRGTTVTLGADDVADATELGLGAGHMVVWVKADLAATTPATFTLTKGEKTVDVTINAA